MQRDDEQKQAEAKATTEPEVQKQIEELDCTDPLNYTGGRPDNPEKWLGTCQNDGTSAGKSLAASMIPE